MLVCGGGGRIARSFLVNCCDYAGLGSICLRITFVL